MKELSKYQCEHCKTEYKDKQACVECENNHRIKLKIKDKRYVPISRDKNGYPIDINIEFEDGEVIKYKRN